METTKRCSGKKKTKTPVALLVQINVPAAVMCLKFTVCARRSGRRWSGINAHTEEVKGRRPLEDSQITVTFQKPAEDDLSFVARRIIRRRSTASGTINTWQDGSAPVYDLCNINRGRKQGRNMSKSLKARLLSNCSSTARNLGLLGGFRDPNPTSAASSPFTHPKGDGFPRDTTNILMLFLHLPDPPGSARTQMIEQQSAERETAHPWG